MELEDTGIVVNVQYIPDTIMSDAEYKSKRDAAVQSMLQNRLATKGILMFQARVDERLLQGIPQHQSTSIILEQYGRHAEHEFNRQMDSNCATCSHKKVDVFLEHDAHTRGISVKAKCGCEAKLKGGTTCFDGYMPASNSWLWPEYATRDVTFRVDRPNEKGLVFAHMMFRVDHDPLELYDPNEPPYMRKPKSPFGDVRDEPPGQMTRVNADGAYMTSEEIKMADAALKRLKKEYRHSIPSPQPQTPMEDAW